MKIHFISIMLLGLFDCCNSNKQSNKNAVEKNINTEMADTSFKYHFNILDSAIRAKPNDSIYTCCSPSIKFMEVNTGIDAHSDGTLLGKLVFSKEDLRKWHEWYDKKYGKK
jgi:hypothetical protein